MTDEPEAPAEEQQPEPEQPSLTFEQKVSLPLTALLRNQFEEVPELRSVVVVLDWQGDLNKALAPCLWFDKHGPISPRRNLGDVITGSMTRTMQAMEHQAVVAFNLIAALGATITQQEEQLENLEGQLNDASQQLCEQASEQEGQEGVGEETPDDSGGTGD